MSGLTEAASACRLILFLICSAHLNTRGRMCVCVLAGATKTPTANRNLETLEAVIDLRPDQKWRRLEMVIDLRLNREVRDWRR